MATVNGAEISPNDRFGHAARGVAHDLRPPDGDALVILLQPLDGATGNRGIAIDADDLQFARPLAR